MKFSAAPGYGFMNMRWHQRPGKCICIDLVVLHHSTQKGTKFIFTMLDAMSHFPDAYALAHDSAKACAECILKWSSYNGLPEEIRSDGGANLNLSEIFKELYKLLKITSIVSQPYAPQGNTVERFHRWLGAALRILFYKYDLDVDETLPIILWIYRGTVCRTTGFTPALLHLGREMRFPLDVFDGSTSIETSPSEYADHIRELMQKVWEQARVAQMIAQEESAYHYNKKHGIKRDLRQGDEVFVRNIPRNPSEVSTHLLPRCSGPYKLLRVTTKGAMVKHKVTGATRNESLRYIKRAYSMAKDDSDNDERDEERYSEGDYVVVRLHARKNERRKWQVGKLVHTTPDEEQWILQWCNTESAGSMINAQYKLAWMLPDGVTERFDDTQQRGWQPVWHAVHKRRFLTPAFNMRNGRLPSSIRAILRSKFPNANL